jgi:iron complex transport system ATP-binding protein
LVDEKASIQVKGLSFSYGKRRVLKDVTFEVRAGEFVGVLGPNGSGKSTLLNCLSGLLVPDRKKVKVCRKDVAVTGSNEMARLVAIVPQDSSMNFAFPVEEVVLMGRYSHISRFRFEDAQDYVVAQEAMKETGIWSLRSRLVTDLSGGERQRVVIARALAQEPRVLLLDEPTTHLDIRHQLEVLGLIRRLNKEKGITVLGVFHDLNLAARFCDRIFLLSHGRLAATGEPEEVLTATNIQRVFGIGARIGKTGAGKVAIEVGEPTKY